MWRISCLNRLWLSRNSLLLAALLAVGCGAGSGTVTGKVSYEGKPIPAGRVTFLDGKGQTYSSPIGDDGGYSIPKVPAGEVKIAVDTGAPPPNIPAPAAVKGKTGAPPGVPPEALKAYDFEAQRAKYVKIPNKYKDPEKSGLTYTVTGGSQTHDIVLK
jgi:hypothetical protein